MESSGDLTTVETPLSHRCRSLQAARRVLLFSAVNCLTVVFHQHDANSGTNSASSPNGRALLQKPELQNVLIEIMDNVDSYGWWCACCSCGLNFFGRNEFRSSGCALCSGLGLGLGQPQPSWSFDCYCSRYQFQPRQKR